MSTLTPVDPSRREPAPPWAPPLAAPVETGMLLHRPRLADDLSGRQLSGLVALWLGVALVGMVLVAFGLGPFLFQRDQRVLLEQARQDINSAANQAFTLEGVVAPTKAIEPGTAVGILEIGRIQMQQAVVEGVSSSYTQRGPGHVPGTAGPGQPGNSVILGRHATFGAAFADIEALTPGDEVLVSTIQGEAVYKVDSVRRQTILAPGEKVDLVVDPYASGTPGTTPGTAPGEAGPSGTVLGAAPGTTAVAPLPPAPDTIGIDQLLGPSDDDRLTLVTSAGASPFNTRDAIVVVARMVGEPFPPTPPNGRTDSQTGLTGDGSAATELVLIVLGLSATVLIAIVLYRSRSSFVAYLLTVPPLLMFVLLGGETMSRILPAWT